MRDGVTGRRLAHPFAKGRAHTITSKMGDGQEAAGVPAWARAGPLAEVAQGLSDKELQALGPCGARALKFFRVHWRAQQEGRPLQHLLPEVD